MRVWDSLDDSSGKTDRALRSPGPRCDGRPQLPGYIKSLKSKGELSVLIGGDKNARYESVLQVMDELRKQGIQKVGLQVKTTQ